MRIADYPKTIKKAEQYTAGDIAVLYGVSHRTACKMIDDRVIQGHSVPGSKERRVLHASLLAHVEANPSYSHVLAKLAD